MTERIKNMLHVFNSSILNGDVLGINALNMGGALSLKFTEEPPATLKLYKSTDPSILLHTYNFSSDEPININVKADVYVAKFSFGTRSAGTMQFGIREPGGSQDVTLKYDPRTKTFIPILCSINDKIDVDARHLDPGSKFKLLNNASYLTYGGKETFKASNKIYYEVAVTSGDITLDHINGAQEQPGGGQEIAVGSTIIVEPDY